MNAEPLVVDYEGAAGRMMQVMVERHLGFPAWSREDYFAMVAAITEGVLPATQEFKTVGPQWSDDENQDEVDVYRLVSEWLPT